MLAQILKNNQHLFTDIFPFNLNQEKHHKLDLSIDNEALYSIDLSSVETLQQYISDCLQQTGAKYAIGGYQEDRLIYRKSKHFGEGKDARSIHLGTDVWLAANTNIAAPLDGKIHSFKNNHAFGDYGPTIILEHCVEGTTFFTLYGHLSVESLKGKNVGQEIKQGELFAELGNDQENGNWPTHLHFQIIADMNGREGDFPGVSNQADRENYLDTCPDPNLILRLK